MGQLDMIVRYVRQEMGVTEVLLTTAVALSSYLVLRWLKDPLRKIPGPRAVPFFGNIFMLKPERMHLQFSQFAEEYGPVFKISIFNQTIVVLNSAEICLEALTRKGTDFQGRPPTPRITYLLGTDVAFSSFDHPSYPLLRRVATKGLKAYGTGVAHLENLMQDVIQEVIEILNNKDGQPIDTHQLSYGYVCSVMVSILYGETHSFDDPICQAIHQMNERMVTAADPVQSAAIMDIFPILFKLRRFLFNKTHCFLEETKTMSHEHIIKKINEAKETYNANHKRGCLDYFIESQLEERDEAGNTLIPDSHIEGLLINFVVGGMETSLSSLCQAFLDLLHDKALSKRIQSQIDANFEPGEQITLKDRDKLPLLDAYLHENLRLLTQVPLLLPHSTIRDTEIGGYEIPARTRVFFNVFSASHDPEVYPQPFSCTPERYLDKTGQIVPPGHPVRRNFIGFGAGRRQCPGELLARSRIFLLLANILQKFDVEPADGEIPERDVRGYTMGVIVKPPPVSARFKLRLQ